MAKGETPAKRSERYARELKSGKNELTGKPLTKGQRRFRNGVLNERSWGLKIFNRKKSNKPKTSKSKGKPKTTVKRGAYNAVGKVSENLVDDTQGAVVFFDGGNLPF